VLNPDAIRTTMRRSFSPTAFPDRPVDLLAFIAGLILPLAFAPYGLYPLAILAPAALFWSWLGCSPRRALWRGLLFGLGTFGVGVSWIQESFQFSFVPPLVALALTAGFVGFLACYPAVLGYLLARLSTGGHVQRLLLAFPAAWVMAEWVRGWFLTGFTWLQLGYSQADSPLRHLAPLGGVYLLSWVCAFSAAALVLVIVDSGRRRWLGIPLAAAVWIAALGFAGVRWSEPAGAAQPVALLQGNVSQDLKWRPDQRAPTLGRYLGLTRGSEDARLIVWPETALPGFYQSFTDYLARLDSEVRQRQATILLGVPYRETAGSPVHNSVAVVGGDGGLYHKRHLVPFGEYLPLKGFLGPLTEVLRIQVSDFSPGPDKPPTLEAAGFTVGVSICYEVTFGREVREALPAAQLLINVTNDAWFGDSIGPHQHLQIARMRALETGRYLLRAANTGISAVIGPDGRIIARSRQFRTEILKAMVPPMTGTTPYVRFGDRPVLAALFLLLAVNITLTRRARSGPDAA